MYSKMNLNDTLMQNKVKLIWIIIKQHGKKHCSIFNYKMLHDLLFRCGMVFNKHDMLPRFTGIKVLQRD